jgi:hypothetical protein
MEEVNCEKVNDRLFNEVCCMGRLAVCYYLVIQAMIQGRSGKTAHRMTCDKLHNGRCYDMGRMAVF